MNIYPQTASRTFPSEQLHADLLVAGGGLAGLCAALAAARDGLQVVLIQDRPVLGGNASSEVRLWANGATSHMGNNNRWAREGGIMGEILEENLWRNKEGNPVMFDLVLLDMAKSQPGLTLLLNTTIYEVEKNQRTLTQVSAFNAINETFYTVTADQFCDATGDGVLGFLAGAEYREGAEEVDELGGKKGPRRQLRPQARALDLFLHQTDERPGEFCSPFVRVKRYYRDSPLQTPDIHPQWLRPVVAGMGRTAGHHSPE